MEGAEDGGGPEGPRGRREGRAGTNLAIKVENAIAVIDGDSGARDEPRGDLAIPNVEDGEVAPQEQDELEGVVSHEGVPQPGGDRLRGL